MANSSDEISIIIENCNMKISKYKKLLGIKIDNTLNFNCHVDEICKKNQERN